MEALGSSSSSWMTGVDLSDWRMVSRSCRNIIYLKSRGIFVSRHIHRGGVHTNQLLFGDRSSFRRKSKIWKML